MKIGYSILGVISITVLPILTTLSIATESLPIIPGAEGFGMETPAGSGRHLSQPKTKVIKVTNLKNTGHCSLRTALTTEGARIIIFEVSGYIDLNESITIKYPYLTVAGQTAPWPGVIVRGGYTIHVGTHDVLIQHLGFRPGGQIKGRYIPHRGAVSVNGENVIIDHCSMGWSQQAAINVNRSNVTIRHNIPVRDASHQLQ